MAEGDDKKKRTPIKDGVLQGIQNIVGTTADTVKKAADDASKNAMSKDKADDSSGDATDDGGAGGGADYYSSYNGGGSSGPSAKDRKSAANQIEIAKKDADATRRQLDRQLSRFDFMDRQNRSLRDVNMAQASRQSADNRFDALTNLANSAMGILGALGPQALQSSGLGTFMDMMQRRNLQDSGTYWSELSQNWDTSRNAYDESAAQNRASMLDAVIETEKALADQESSLSANLNNIDASLYQTPGTGSADLGSSKVFGDNKVKEHNAVLAGYAVPDYVDQMARRKSQANRASGSDYFSRQVNRNNGYR